MSKLRMLRRLTAALCALLLCCAQSMAELSLLPDYDPVTRPLEITASVSVAAHMPLSDERVQELNALLSSHELRFSLSGQGGTLSTGMAVYVDGDQAFDLNITEGDGKSSVMSSLLPGRRFTSTGPQALSLLLGTEVADDGICEPLTLLNAPDDAVQLLMNLQEKYAAQLTTVKKKNTVNGYGVTTLVKTMEIPAADAALFLVMLKDCCPEGGLRGLLDALTFTGEQKLSLLTEDNGTVHKCSWEGQCGTGDDIRKITLTWRLTREDRLTRDSLTIRGSGSVNGAKSEISLERWIRTVKNNLVDTTAFSFEDTRGGTTEGLAFEWQLNSRTGNDGSRPISGTGSLTVKTKDGKRIFALTLDSAVAADGITWSGKLGVQQKQGSHALEDATFTFAAAPIETAATPTDLQAAPPALVQLVSLDGMTEEARAALRDELMSSATLELLKRWVLLPQEKTLYISKDLPEDVWQQIAYAALALTE